MTKDTHKPAADESAAAPDQPDQNDVTGASAGGPYNRSFETRFQKGRSGNPSGRKKGSRNKSKIVEEILNEQVTIRDGTRTRKMSKFELMVTQMVNDAAKGNHKAQASVFLLIRTYNLVDSLPESDVEKPLTADDDALIANIFARHGYSPPFVRNDNEQTAVPPSKPGVQ